MECQDLTAYGDFNDIEDYILQSSAAPSIDLIRPHFPRWRRQLLENGIERVSVSDTAASDLMILFIQNAMPKPDQNGAAVHDHRNLLNKVGVPMLRKRGWKDPSFACHDRPA